MHTPSVPEHLENPLYYLNRARSPALDLALLRSAEGRVVPIFTAEALATLHLPALPEGVTVEEARDLRAKEELFQAALERGATELWLDPPPRGEPRNRYPLERSLDYVRSFKRQSACL
jgi:hypothetical protein